MVFLIDDEDVHDDAYFEGIDIYETYDKDTQFSMEFVTRIFRFLQLLCENHFFELQDLLRVQEVGKHFDIVQMMAY